MSQVTVSVWRRGCAVLAIALGAGASSAAAQPAANESAVGAGPRAAAADVAGWSRSYGDAANHGMPVAARFGGPYHQYGYEQASPVHASMPGYGYAGPAPYTIRPYYYDTVFPSHYRPNHFGFAWYRPAYPGHGYGYTPGFYTPYGTGFYGGYGYNAFVSGAGDYGCGAW